MFMSLLAVGAMLAFANQAQAQLGLQGGTQGSAGNAGGQITGKTTGGGVAGQATGQISGNGAGQSVEANQAGAIRTGNGALNADDRVGVEDGNRVPALNNGRVKAGVGIGGNANVPGAVDANGRLNTGVGGSLNQLPAQTNSGLKANGQIIDQSTVQGGAVTGHAGQMEGKRVTAYSQGAAAGNLSMNNGWSNGGNYRRGFRIFPIFRNRGYYR